MARMVRHLGNYPWSSYQYNVLGKPDTGITPHDCWQLPGEEDPARREAYRALFRNNLDQLDIERIRHSITTGLPTGNNRFRREIENALSIKPGQWKRGRPGKNKIMNT